MSFQATFTVEDKTYDVISFNYNTKRDHDRSGRAVSLLSGLRIEMLIESSPNTVFLHLWASQNHDFKTGTITFMKRENFQKQTEIKFTEGYIVDINLNFENIGDHPMTERIVLFAKTVEYTSQGNQAIMDAEWPV